MKKYLKLLWGSKLYGLTNKQSDEDYVIICVDKNDPELEQYKNDPNIEIFTTSEFQEKLNDHDLKAIEILFAHFGKFSFTGYYEPTNNIDVSEDYTFAFYFRLDKNKLRSSVSKVVSNAYVKSKKKFIDGEYYIGAKSYYHCFRILTMFISLAKREHFKPDAYQKDLDFIYNRIVLNYNKYLDDSLSPLESWKNMDNEYNVYLKSLQHTFKLYCPKK